MAYKPKDYLVIVHVVPTPRNQLTKSFTGRVGFAATLAEAKELIASDRVSMNETFSGLISAPGVQGRSYQVFRAVWTEVKL